MHPNPADRLHRARLDLATALEHLTAETRLDLVIDACIDTGGSLIPPRMCGEWGSPEAELSLMGVSHSGADEGAAIAGWIKAVLRMESAGHEQSLSDRLAAALQEAAK